MPDRSDATRDRVAIRAATLEDVRQMWEWRNDPGARAVSFTTREIPFEEHRAWFTRAVADARLRLFVILADGRAVGYVRFAVEGDGAEISVGVDARDRGRGYGTAAIAIASDLMLAGPVRSIVAHVKTDNPGSRGAFERAGFVLGGTVQIDGVEAWALVYRGRPVGAEGPMTATPAPRAVLFRVDAAATSGLGHLQRCLSLALALRRDGVASGLLSDGHPEAERRAAALGVESARLDGARPGGAEDVDRTLAEAVRLAATHVVVDSYHVTADYLARVRDAGYVVAAIDDLAAYSFPCQLVINGGAQAGGLPYRSSRDTRFLLGPRYVLLRPEFRDLPARVVRPEVQNVLIAVGGADPRGLLPILLEVAGLLPTQCSITAIAAPLSARAADVDVALARCLRPVLLMRDPPSVRDLMLEADLALSAGGQTMYELAATGTPTVAVVAADNQIASVRAMADAGVVRAVCGVGDASFRERVRDAVVELLSGRDARTAMAAAGRALVDGRGAERVARTLISLGTPMGRAGAL